MLRIRTSVVLRHKTLVFESAVIESGRSNGAESLQTRNSDDFAESTTVDNDEFFDDAVLQEGAGEDVLPIPVRQFCGREGRQVVVRSWLNSLRQPRPGW